MKGRIRCGALLFACAFLFVLPSAASARLFVEFDSPNLRGESNVVGFEDQIEARSFQLGVGRSAKDKPASFSEITITKDLDRASPGLMLRVADGAIIPSAKVRFTKSSDGGETTFLRYCFTGVQISGFSQSSGGDRPSESISFSYGTIVQSYTQQNATGGVVGVFSSGWDVLKNLQFGGACDN